VFVASGPEAAARSIASLSARISSTALKCGVSLLAWQERQLVAKKALPKFS
jgi:hypothetical protein